MAHYEEKEGFKNITEVRNFLYGTNNRKHSKPYLRIKEQDGYYYLTIWLDNNYTLDDINGDQQYLNSINGFKEHYQLKMNKVEHNDFLMETVQDITTIVWGEVIKANNPDGIDSREIFSTCRDWAVEFEKIWYSYIEQGVEDEHDYMLEVEEFAMKKFIEFSHQDAEETPKKKKFTFRFHTHGWTDITVEAENEEEAQELADDKYNNGEYDDDASGFENTDCENITEE